jgi:RNA polymerase-binding transcription factor DksA
MKENSNLQNVPEHVCAGTTHCVLCGKRIGAIRFKGRLICRSCVEYARTIS